jgi:hypothetical protein
VTAPWVVGAGVGSETVSKMVSFLPSAAIVGNRRRFTTTFRGRGAPVPTCHLPPSK